MSVQLDHLIVPSTDRVAGARLLSRLIGVPWDEQGRFGPFSPVHDAAQVDAILGRIRAAPDSTRR